jgi:DUF917 family protein
LTPVIHIDPHNARDLGMGAAVLSAGGGSFPYLELLALLEQLSQAPPVKLMAADCVSDTARVALVAMMGAPLPMFERFADPQHFARPVRVLAKHLRSEFDYVMGYEIGSMNALIPVMVAAELGLPLIDADTLGRSFPEIQMSALAIEGVDMTPLAVSDIRANDIVLDHAANGAWVEKLLRPMATACGSILAMAGSHTGAQIKACAHQGTYSRAMRIGKAIREAQAAHQDPVGVLLTHERGHVVLRGKIVDVERRADDGFVRGRVHIRPDGGGDPGIVHFQNEYLLVERNDRRVAMVPDLIAMLGSERGEPLGTEALRYGQYVSVVRLPPMPRHLTPKALAVVGPRSFGYDFDYMTQDMETRS